MARATSRYYYEASSANEAVADCGHMRTMDISDEDELVATASSPKFVPLLVSHDNWENSNDFETVDDLFRRVRSEEDISFSRWETSRT